MFFRFLLIIILTAVSAAPAFAEGGSTPKSLGVFGVWIAYAYTENGQQVCYMASKIHVASSKKLKRSTALMTITHRPGENSKDVVSFTAGYNFKPNSDVDVHVGKDNFNLFTQKDTAWSRDAMTDHALAAAIRKNASMSITGTPVAKGVASVTDTVDLKGAVSAYSAIGKACGYPEEKKAAPAAKKPAKTNIKTTKH